MGLKFIKPLLWSGDCVRVGFTDGLRDGWMQDLNITLLDFSVILRQIEPEKQAIVP